MTIGNLFGAIRVALLLLAVAGAGRNAGAAAADPSAVVIMYHRFGETSIPSTNIGLGQIDAHIKELKTGGYTVLPLTRIVAAIRAREALPDRTVGIAIDDGFVSVFGEAWPRFKKAGLPFTIFIASDDHDQPIRGYMTWAQIAEMAKDPLVEVGAHSAAHAHMAAMATDKIAADLNRSLKAYADRLGLKPRIFAYPFGEAGDALKAAVKAAGFEAAFGQHSGAFSGRDDPFYLPRFAFNEKYGDLKRFKTAVDAKAFPIADVDIGDSLVRPTANPPRFAFSVDPMPKGFEKIHCFGADGGKFPIDTPKPGRISLRFFDPFGPGRTRVNCTLPAENGRWYWFGWQFYVPR